MTTNNVLVRKLNHASLANGCSSEVQPSLGNHTEYRLGTAEKTET